MFWYQNLSKKKDSKLLKKSASKLSKKCLKIDNSVAILDYGLWSTCEHHSNFESCSEKKMGIIQINVIQFCLQNMYNHGKLTCFKDFVNFSWLVMNYSENTSIMTIFYDFSCFVNKTESCWFWFYPSFFHYIIQSGCGGRKRDARA